MGGVEETSGAQWIGMAEMQTHFRLKYDSVCLDMVMIGVGVAKWG